MSEKSSSTELIGVVFERPGEYGDFAWMIDQPEYADALFIFNDNEEQFIAYRSDPRPPWACTEGGGNAVIRPYQCQDPPRAAGIPTGSGGSGYQELNDHVRSMVDRAASDISELLTTGRYERLFYSSDGKGGLGTGIFKVADEVKDRIVKNLKEAAGGE